MVPGTRAPPLPRRTPQSLDEVACLRSLTPVTSRARPLYPASAVAAFFDTGPGAASAAQRASFRRLAADQAALAERRLDPGPLDALAARRACGLAPPAPAWPARPPRAVAAAAAPASGRCSPASGGRPRRAARGAPWALGQLGCRPRVQRTPAHVAEVHRRAGGAAARVRGDELVEAARSSSRSSARAGHVSPITSASSRARWQAAAASWWRAPAAARRAAASQPASRTGRKSSSGTAAAVATRAARATTTSAEATVPRPSALDAAAAVAGLERRPQPDEQLRRAPAGGPQPGREAAGVVPAG